ncbi:hypothetical protein [Nocardioides currus]|uniref:Uncharacterized protein n=1 Tax=Nocardioides currus TaxID=2133958 RepID=A0A2R7YSC8_9ACTN|nr:hypothetical protein [Nocardioides currus]PUA79318.1 hypothetical protein C7S10_20085 [Nocardioides currus]
MTSGDELERSEVEAVLETRRDLGRRYDKELVDGFADRVEAEVARRVGQELDARRRADSAHASAGPRQLALGIVSLVPVGIPVTAINIAAGDSPSIVGLVISWAGIVGVNVAHAWQSRRA